MLPRDFCKFRIRFDPFAIIWSSLLLKAPSLPLSELIVSKAKSIVVMPSAEAPEAKVGVNGFAEKVELDTS